MPLLKRRDVFKPFEYQWAYDAWLSQKNAHWLHTQINMQKDIKDWTEVLDEKEKNLIGNILKGFTQTEIIVGDYWSGYVANWFKIPEIKMMTLEFGATEMLHVAAYSYLNDTLGLIDFEAFLQDEATMQKLNTLMDIDPNDTSISNIARSLALFSACAEGIQLYSSFAVLMSFKKRNLLTGICKQMEYSVKDESLHSQMGCKLFRTLISENQDVWTEELKSSLYEGVDLALKNEFFYIDKIFEYGDIETIKKDELKNFMYDRANRKLKELMLNPVYEVDSEKLMDMDWFYVVTAGEQQTDFFFNHETSYSEPNDDWNKEDIF